MVDRNNRIFSTSSAAHTGRTQNTNRFCRTYIDKLISTSCTPDLILLIHLNFDVVIPIQKKPHCPRCFLLAVPGNDPPPENLKEPNYFHRRANSGFVEGFNNKLRVLTRRCYGIKRLDTLTRRLRLFVRNRHHQAPLT